MGTQVPSNFPHFLLTSPPSISRAAIPPYLVVLAGLEVQAGGQGAPCAPQGLGLVTTQFWSRSPLHTATTCWEDKSVTGEQ